MTDGTMIDRTRVQAVLVSALESLHRATGAPKLVAEAIAVAREVVVGTPRDHPLYAQRVSDAAELCFQEWRRTQGKPALLTEAVHLYRLALHNTAAARGDLAYRFAYALRAHAASSGGPPDPALLREAADAYRAATDLLRADHPLFAVCWANLANTLVDLHQRNASPADAAAAVDAARAAVAATRQDDPQFGERQAVLAAALAVLGRHTESSDTLDEAIARLRAAAEAQTDPALRATVHYNLGADLAMRYARTNDLPTLEEAVAARRLGLAEVPVDDVRQRAVHLVGLGMLLQMRYQHTGAAQTAEEAFRVLREAVDTAPHDHPERAMMLAELAAASSFRALSGDDASGHLDSAVASQRAAVQLTTMDDPRRGQRLARLAVMYLHRYDLQATPEDLDEAVAAVRHALECRDDEPVVLDATARVMLRDHERTGDSGSLREAADSARRLARTATSPVLRIRSAALWAKVAWAAGRRGEAATASALAVESLAAAGRHELNQTDRARLLAEYPSIASDAAAYALRNGDADDALGLLEQGRGILLGEAMEHGGALLGDDEVQDLQRRHPQLWERFLAWNMEHWVGRIAAMDTAGLHMVVPYDSRRAAARQGDDVLAEIRETPGFQDFLRPPPAERLLAAARGGPVVTVNVSELGSDALLLSSAGLTTVPLPGLTPESVAAQVATLYDATHQRMSVADAGDAVHEVLSWLWDHAAAPVLDALGPAAAGRPRLWWCPTGLLAFLPLHAAGHHRGSGGDTVLDRVVPSYTPLVRTLLRRSDSGRPVPEDPLVVAMPRTPGWPDLPGAVREEEQLRELFPRMRALVGEAATKHAVLSALKSAPWVHFACHARAAGSGLSRSAHLLLHDGELSLREVFEMRLPDAELAFLAACDTARGSAPLANESLHVAGAFQLAGYRHVIGSLWPVPDHAAAALTHRTYDTLRTHEGGPARAVRETALWARENLPNAPWLWAAHCHFGP